MSNSFLIAILMQIFWLEPQVITIQAEPPAGIRNRYLQSLRDGTTTTKKEEFDHHRDHHPKRPHMIKHHHHETIVKEYPVPEPVPIRVPVRVPIRIPVNVPFKVPIKVPLRVPVVKYVVNTIRHTKWINGPSSHVAVKDTKTTAVASNNAIHDHATAVDDRQIGVSNTATALKDARSASSDKMFGISDTVTPAGGFVAGGGGSGGAISADMATAGGQDLSTGDVEQPPVPLSTPVPTRI